jgi:hypothetical protein
MLRIFDPIPTLNMGQELRMFGNRYEVVDIKTQEIVSSGTIATVDSVSTIPTHVGWLSEVQ